MEKSGGMLHEQATHQLDMIRYIAGEIVEVYKIDAMQINVDQENHTIPDAEVVTLQFESGAVGYISTSSALINGGGGTRTDFIVEGHYTVQLAWATCGSFPKTRRRLRCLIVSPSRSMTHLLVQFKRGTDRLSGHHTLMG